MPLPTSIIPVSLTPPRKDKSTTSCNDSIRIAHTV